MILTLHFIVTENESLQLLMPNVQNLSGAIQSLLKDTEIASLQNHSESVQSKLLPWKGVRQKGRIRVASLASKKKELENSGM